MVRNFMRIILAAVLVATFAVDLRVSSVAEAVELESVSMMRAKISDWNSVTFDMPVGDSENLARVSATKTEDGFMCMVTVEFKGITVEFPEGDFEQFPNVRLHTIALSYTGNPADDSDWHLMLSVHFGDAVGGIAGEIWGTAETYDDLLSRVEYSIRSGRIEAVNVFSPDQLR